MSLVSPPIIGVDDHGTVSDGVSLARRLGFKFFNKIVLICVEIV